MESGIFIQNNMLYPFLNAVYERTAH